MACPRPRRSARTSSSIASCSPASPPFPAISKAQSVYEVGPGPGGLTGALLDAGATRHRRRTRPPLPPRACRAWRAVSRQAHPDRRRRAQDRRGAPGRPRRARRLQPPLQCRHRAAAALARRRLDALVVEPDADVPEGSGRADRRQARRRRLRPPRGGRAMARDPADRASRPPLGLRAPAQGHLGGGPHRPRCRARRRPPPSAGTPYRRRLRPAPQDVATEPQGRADALDALPSLGIAAERRAETVSVDEWVALAKSCSKAVLSSSW